MSQNPGRSSGGKITRERRRLSSDQPYSKCPRVGASTMPATRRSPARPPPQEVDLEAEQLPLGGLLQELALLRKSMETKFSEAEKRTDALRNEVVGKLDANDQALSEVQLAVTDVTLSVDQNSRAIHEVRAEVERREAELPGKVRAIVQEALDRPRDRQDSNTGRRHRPLRPAASSVSPDRLRPASRAEEAYDKARRSLRLWPVSREGDLMDRTIEFLVAELLLDQQYATGLNLDVRRASAPPRSGDREAASRIKDEVIVVFENRRERDNVRSHAKHLEKKGRGLRLEVPDHLWPSFRSLQDLAFELKKKTPSLRRNVLFDDAARDLKMDFSTDSATWKTVVPEEARKSLRKCRPSRPRRQSVTANDLEALLGSSDVEDMNVTEEE